MAVFSTIVTKAQRNAIDWDLRGRSISICSRQNTRRPGYNPSPYEPKPTKKEKELWSLGKALKEKVTGKDASASQPKKIKVTAKSRKDKR